MRLSTARLARFSARHSCIVIGSWLALVVVIAGAGSALGSRFTGDISFTDQEESKVALDLLKQQRGPAGLSEQVIVESQQYRVEDPQFQSAVQSVEADLRAMTTDVTATISYYEAPDPRLVSADHHTTLLPTQLAGDVEHAGTHADALLAILARHDGQGGFTVVSAGVGSMNATFNQTAKHDLQSEERALPIALIILVLVFGAVAAALVPMVLAGLGILLATSVAILVSHVWPLSIFVTNMIVMMGLALGIDYSLFVVQRYREERRQGAEKVDAITRAGDTAARAVLFSGITVVIALAGLLLVPTNLFKALGAGAIFAAVASVAIGLTLLPAVLSVLGDRIDWLSIPFFSRRGATDDRSGFWARAAHLVMAHPVPSLVGALALLLALAAPVLSERLGAGGAETFPHGSASYRAFQILGQEFSVGRSAPTQIVIQAADVHAPPVVAAVSRLQAAIAADGQIKLLQSVGDGPTPNGSVDLVTVTLPGSLTSQTALDALRRLRTDIVPAALQGSGAHGYVGGQTAGNADFFRLVDRYTPVVFAFVLSLSFVLLLLVFRSIVVPLKAILMNLLSVGAAYGVLVLVFQRGLGAKLLGLQRTPVIEAWIPLFLFAILFGLSMDYHVFLLSRIRERYDQTSDNAGSVAYGLRSTANIITGAAAIMVVVFGGFALGDLSSFQQMGFGLAVAVLLDATVVRMILVPSAMELLGDRNWYLPSWLHWLWDLRVEGGRATERQSSSGDLTASAHQR